MRNEPNHDSLASDTLHLEGSLLEALAADAATGEQFEQGNRHLQACAVCRAEVESMRKENRLFAAEYSAGAGTAFHGQADQRRWQVRIYAMAAALVLATTLVFMHSLTTMVQDPKEVGAKGPAPVQAPAEEQTPKPAEPPPPPAPTVPPIPVPPNNQEHLTQPTQMPQSLAQTKAEEAVYEGKSAEDWLRSLKDFEKVYARNDPERQKAFEQVRHAISRIGGSAIPTLLEALEKKEYSKKDIADLLAALKPTKERLPTFLDLLKNPDFEVRRTAIRLLGPVAATEPAVAKALEGMLKDRDQAVVEEAEKALEREIALWAKSGELVKRGDELQAEKRYSEALRIYQDALASQPAAPNADNVRQKIKTIKQLIPAEEARIRSLVKSFAEDQELFLEAYRSMRGNLKPDDVIVTPEILAKAEVGDHFETINLDRPDTHSAFGNPDSHLFQNVNGNDALEDEGGSFGSRTGGGRKLMITRRAAELTLAVLERARQIKEQRRARGGSYNSGSVGEMVLDGPSPRPKAPPQPAPTQTKAPASRGGSSSVGEMELEGPNPKPSPAPSFEVNRTTPTPQKTRENAVGEMEIGR